MPNTVLISFIIGTLILLGRVLLVGRRPKRYPPGPPTLPIVGNLHQFPKHNSHLQFQKWAEQYGPIYSLIMGTKTFVVLSSDEVVKALLDKRSQIYSGRPDMYIANDLASGNLRYLLMSYNDHWRSSRKISHSLLNVQISKKYIIYQDMEIKQVLHDLLETPENFRKHVRRFATSLSAIMIFGFRCPTYDDEEVTKLYEVVDQFSAIVRSPTASIMDAYPILQYIPDSLNPLARTAKRMFEEALELYLKYWDHVKNDQKAGLGVHSFAQDLALTHEKEGLNERFSAFMAGMLLEGGSDTTSTMLAAFIQVMAVYPYAQQKAQEEVDRVIGPSRLPTIDDWNDLPYVRACIKEILRWLPPATLGAPHATMEQDLYQGYVIPRGATVISNVWAINMDEKRAPSGRVFRPERHLGDDLSAGESAAQPDPTKRDHFSFGAGRRLCPGIHVAERSLFLGMSRLLWGFNMKKAKGPDGKEIEIQTDSFSDGLILTLAPFQVDIKPRDSDKVKMIRAEWSEAKTKFQEMKLAT